MSTFHVANTYFEMALLDSVGSIEEGMRLSPVTRQLQYLPFLYGEEGDQVWVDREPESEWTPFEGMPEAGRELLEGVEVWGWSDEVRNAFPTVLQPSHEAVLAANSKAFSFEHSPRLEGSCLIFSAAELAAWKAQLPVEGVLKSCFGLSGRGHRWTEEEVLSFCRKEWDRGLPVVGEPWVDRELDFSSQWEVGEEIRLQGLTLLENSERGEYRSTVVGAELPEGAVEEHCEVARALLERLKQKGYFGPVGVDAFLYRSQGRLKLQPIVEVNGRRTMAQVALRIQQRRYPGRRVRFTYVQGECGVPLLPRVRGCRRQLWMRLED